MDPGLASTTQLGHVIVQMLAIPARKFSISPRLQPELGCAPLLTLQPDGRNKNSRRTKTQTLSTVSSCFTLFRKLDGPGPRRGESSGFRIIHPEADTRETRQLNVENNRITSVRQCVALRLVAHVKNH